MGLFNRKSQDGRHGGHELRAGRNDDTHEWIEELVLPDARREPDEEPTAPVMETVPEQAGWIDDEEERDEAPEPIAAELAELEDAAEPDQPEPDPEPEPRREPRRADGKPSQGRPAPRRQGRVARPRARGRRRPPLGRRDHRPDPEAAPPLHARGDRAGLRAQDEGLRLRQPEGRRRQDDDDAQPRGGAVGVRAPGPLRGPRPAGQPDDEPGDRPRQGREKSSTTCSSTRSRSGRSSSTARWTSPSPRSTSPAPRSR